MHDLRIGDLAREAGVTVEAIRYYERLGVLEEAPRNALGHRRYGARALRELRLLKAAQEVGFSLADIGRMLALTREEPVQCRPMCGLVEEHLVQLDARIGVLTAARERLARALAACEHEPGCVVAERLAFEPVS